MYVSKVTLSIKTPSLKISNDCKSLELSMSYSGFDSTELIKLDSSWLVDNAILVLSPSKIVGVLSEYDIV